MRVTAAIITGHTYTDVCCGEEHALILSKDIRSCLTAQSRPNANAQDRKMPIGRRGLIVPQNTFLEDVIRRSDSLRK